jgi:hypothetical protein
MVHTRYGESCSTKEEHIMAKKQRKIVDVKNARASDKTEEVLKPVEEVQKIVETPVETPLKPVSAVATGAAYAVLAGRPSKPLLISTFGKTGYLSLSWLQRAEKLNMTAEALCEVFRNDPAAVKNL